MKLLGASAVLVGGSVLTILPLMEADRPIRAGVSGVIGALLGAATGYFGRRGPDTWSRPHITLPLALVTLMGISRYTRDDVWNSATSGFLTLFFTIILLFAAITPTISSSEQ